MIVVQAHDTGVIWAFFIGFILGVFVRGSGQ